MKDILIIYSSTDGQTRKISEYIGKILGKERSIKIISIEDVSKIDITSFNNFIIGASIRYGSHGKKIINFIRNNNKYLENKYTSFFSVNAVARKPQKNSPSTNPYIKKFFDKTNWKPSRAQVFAGKIDYPSYRFFDKIIIRFIMLITNGPIDVHTSHDFTNWNDVKSYAMKIIRDTEK